MSHSDLLILRFGDGTLHFTPKSSRLVDVGFYARTRHPAFWFFTIYLYGTVLFFFGFNWWILVLNLGISLVHLMWLLWVQERLLTRSLGDRYLLYKTKTPLLHWKFKIADNLRVGIQSQLTWIVGMVVIRAWYRIKLEGVENIPHDQPFLVVANHECYLDPFLFGIFIPFVMKFVTTADVFTSPLMRFLLRGTGSFPMRRHRQDLKSIRTMIRMINNGQVVCIFPEGGRSTYGAPLPILKETLKLIQRCKVPILPVHLDGAYEIWPRWAPNRRRTNVTTSFKPVIPLEAQTDLRALEAQIKKDIFDEQNILRPVKSKAITRGMDNLLWACYKCRTRNSVKELSGNTITCQHCETEWKVSSDYSYTDTETSHSLTSIEWINDIESDILEYPSEIIFPIDPPPGEEVHLHTPIIRYLSDEEIVTDLSLSLVLTNQRVIVVQGDSLLDSWALNTITIFTMDYFNAVSIGVAGVRHTFKLPPHEIALKWQTYFDILKAKYGETA